MSVLFAEGGGAFGVPVEYAAGSGAQSLTAVDLDANGSQDVVVTNFQSDDIYVFINDGTGVFRAPVIYAACMTPVSVTAADLDGDGKPELAVANAGTLEGKQHNVAVFHNRGDGRLSPPSRYVLRSAPSSVAIADLNADGKPDLAVAGGNNGNVSLLLNRGDGTFAPAVEYAAGFAPHSITAADLDGDNIADLAVANYGDDVSVLLNSCLP